MDAAKESHNPTLKSASKFVGAGLPHMVREPIAVYQLASQQVG